VKKKEQSLVSLERFSRFFANHDLRWGALFVLLVIVNGAVALFYFLLRARLADSTGAVVGAAVVISIFVSVLWIWRSPLRGWRARMQQVAATQADSDSGTSRLPQALQGPSEEKRQQARAKRKKRR
jgi:hypothetical protein